MGNNNETQTTEQKFSTLDMLAVTLDQPRGWKSFVAKNLVQGAFTAISFVAVNGLINKIKQRREQRKTLTRVA